MKDNYTFTFAQNEDLPKILQIFEQSIRADYDVSEGIIQNCLNNLADAFHDRQNDFSFWTATESDSGKVVGWLSYLPIFDSVLKKDSALEANIYLDLEHRANGLGYQFFKFTLLKINKTECFYVYGFVNKHNLNAAKLFKKVGAREIGIIPNTEGSFPYCSEKILYLLKLK